MNVKLNVDELLYTLKYTPSEQNVMLCGKHGIGKSEIITEYYTKSGMKVVPLFLGQMSDPGDIIGLPHKNEELGITEFMLPYWFPIDGQPIVLFLDELNRARPELLQVVMDLVLNRKIAGKELPKGSVIVSAINSGDEYILTDLDPALISRFNIYTFEPTISEWLTWAIKKGISDSVIDFISSHNEFLDYICDAGGDINEKSYDRRSWIRVSNIIKEYSSDDENNSNVDLKFKKLICGIVGSKAGAAFYDNFKNGRFVTPKEVLISFDSVSNKLKESDIIRAMSLCDRLCNYINLKYNMLSKDDMDLYAINFLKFLKLMEYKHKELLGYTASNYESSMYANFNVFVMKHSEVEEYITKFIKDMDI